MTDARFSRNHRDMTPPSIDRAFPDDVIVVEDDPIIALDVEDRLRTLGVSVVRIASSVAHALDLISAQPPDFALLDVGLRHETSFAVAEKLRALGVLHAGLIRAVLENEFRGGQVPGKCGARAEQNQPRLVQPPRAREVGVLQKGAAGLVDRLGDIVHVREVDGAIAGDHGDRKGSL